MAIEGFQDPFITCCFVKDDLIFVNFFHNYSMTHYHFIWDKLRKRILGGQDGLPIMFKMPEANCNMKNFPYQCFFNDEQNEIFSFYRQGQSFTIKPDHLAEFDFQQMTDADLGDMVLV